MALIAGAGAATRFAFIAFMALIATMEKKEDSEGKLSTPQPLGEGAATSSPVPFRAVDTGLFAVEESDAVCGRAPTRVKKPVDR